MLSQEVSSNVCNVWRILGELGSHHFLRVGAPHPLNPSSVCGLGFSTPELRLYYFGVESFWPLAPACSYPRPDCVSKVEETSKCLLYSFRPGSCFEFRLTLVPVSSVPECLPVLQSQHISSSVLEERLCKIVDFHYWQQAFEFKFEKFRFRIYKR